MLVLDMIEILPPLGKYKYDTWRILPMKCYIDNFVRLQSYIRNVNRDLCPYLVTEILKHAAIEVLSIVDCDLLQNSVTADDVLQKKFYIVVKDTLVTGFASIHLVNYSTATTTKV
jgi:hypothetical protein